MIAEKFLVFGIGGGIAIAFAALLYRFRGDGEMLGLVWVLGLGGSASICLALFSVWEVRKIKKFDVRCPYCTEVNVMTAAPEDDFPCVHCNRILPVQDGQVMRVFEIRCGACDTVNYYSAKTELLLCEECNRRIDLLPEGPSSRQIPKNFVPIEEDLNPYELILVDPGNKTEEVAEVLQHMLALNRSQVKQIMVDAPVRLLTGITRRKAEVLQIQLAAHDASAEFRQMPESQVQA